MCLAMNEVHSECVSVCELTNSIDLIEIMRSNLWQEQTIGLPYT